MSKYESNRLSIKVPTPDKTEEGLKFYPIVRIGKVVPYGYVQDPEDPKLLQPVQKELELLEQAKKHLKNYSLRDVANWLSHHTGRKISHVGLRARLMAEQAKDREYLNTRRLLKDLKDAYHKAKKIEASRLGKREPLEEDIDAELFASLSETSRY